MPNFDPDQSTNIPDFFIDVFVTVLKTRDDHVEQTLFLFLHSSRLAFPGQFGGMMAGPQTGMQGGFPGPMAGPPQKKLDPDAIPSTVRPSSDVTKN